MKLKSLWEATKSFQAKAQQEPRPFQPVFIWTQKATKKKKIPINVSNNLKVKVENSKNAKYSQ